MKDIIKSTFPVFVGYTSLGIAMGIYGVGVGVSPWWILLMSVVVYGGAAQFLLAGLIAAGAGVLEIFVAIFLLNVRHIFYTLTLLESFKKLRFRYYSIFALTDETFALLKARDYPDDKLDLAFNLTCGLNQIYWVLGTSLGGFLSAHLGLTLKGVEFSLTALFIVLFYELFRQNRDFRLLLLGVFCASVSVFVVSKEYFLVFSLLLSVVALLLMQRWLR